MYGRIKICLVAAVILAMAATPAKAVFFDNLDSYVADSNVIGQGIWKDWFNGLNPDDGGFVRSTPSYSAENSLEIGKPGRYVDTCWVFSGATSGVWTFSAMTYVPASSNTGWSAINHMNSFPAHDWMGEVRFGFDSNTVWQVEGGTTVSLVKDAWVEYKVDVDVDAYTMDTYYNGQLLRSGLWTGGAVGQKEFVAVNLYSEADTPPMYYDDLTIAPPRLVWDADPANDGDWVLDPANWDPDGPPPATKAAVMERIGDGGTTGVLTVSTSGANKALARSVLIDHGTLDVRTGAELNVIENLSVAAGAALKVNGTLTAAGVSSEGTVSGAGTIEADFDNEGVVSPGSSTGTLAIDGSLTMQQTAEYAAELGGGDKGAYRGDLLSAIDQVTLAGRLSLTALQGFTTPGVKSPTIVESTDWGVDGIVGEFDTMPPDDSHLGRGVFFRDLRTVSDAPATALRAEVFQAIAGDANGDVAFNFTDLIQIFAASGAVYGNPAPPPELTPDWPGGDFTGDGAFTFVDLIDAFSEAGAYYGAPSYPTAEPDLPAGGAIENVGLAVIAAAVPEPGNVLMLLTALVGLLLWRRRP